MFNSLQEYEQFGGIIKKLAKEWNLPENSIFVQGSSLRVSDISKIGDIDIAIKVDASTFDKLVTRFKEATTNTGRRTTITNEALKGKISGGNMFFDKSIDGSFKGKVMNALDNYYGTPVVNRFGIDDIQISIIKNSENLDVSPFLKIK